MPDRQTLAISCDHAGFAMKEALKSHFADRIDWIDLGTDSVESVSYADFGKVMGQAITEGRVKKGIVICGSGNGIAIAANRFPAVRCGLCTDATMARLTREHNDANVIALGARIVGIQVAIDCVEAFLNTEFHGGRHQTRVDGLGQC